MTGFTYNAPRIAMIGCTPASEPSTASAWDNLDCPSADTTSAVLTLVVSYGTYDSNYYKCPEEPPPDDYYYINGNLHEFYRPPVTRCTFTMPLFKLRHLFRSAPRWRQLRWRSNT
jgi:hypothetical protein